MIIMGGGSAEADVDSMEPILLHLWGDNYAAMATLKKQILEIILSTM